MVGPHQWDVFISYSQRDRDAAVRLHEALAARGLRVWRDNRLADAPAQNYITQINQAHTDSARVLVLWSRNSVQSTWVLGEAEKARDGEKIVTLALEPLAGRLPLIPIPFNILGVIDASAPALDLDPIVRALGVVQTEGQRPGIVEPQVEIAALPTTHADILFGRDAELAELIGAWDSPQIHVFALDAMGGAGKTALVQHFLQVLQTGGWRGAQRVFAWSFYSQGASEDRQVSADPFFSAAFSELGGPGTAVPRDPREKGVALAKLVQRRPTLLILDGLEPLQYAGGRAASDAGVAGGIKDPGVKALLVQLAAANPGLCVVTTRLALADLRGRAGAATRALDRLGTADGVALLRHLGVEKRYGDGPLPPRVAKAFEDAIEAVKGHALALRLLGSWLKEFHNGDLRAMVELPSLARLPADADHDPYRVMHAYEVALLRRIREQGGNPAATPAGRQLALLFFLGFFDRPVEMALLRVVFPPGAEALPPGPDDAEAEHRRVVRCLFAGMQAVPLPEWRATLGQLAAAGLVVQPGAGGWHEHSAIDCHPLVRAYFGSRLKELDEPEFQGGHGRLYDHYRFQGLPEAFCNDVTYGVLALRAAYEREYPGARRRLLDGSMTPEERENLSPSISHLPPERLRAAFALVDGPGFGAARATFQPEDDAGMAPLFSAILHGCGAGREGAAFNEVYWPRVRRGNADFAAKELGLLGAELAVLASFFDLPFTSPSPRLAPAS